MGHYIDNKNIALYDIKCFIISVQSVNQKLISCVGT